MNRANNYSGKNLMILTGGKSRRMGSDKSTLPFGRYSVIEYMIEKYGSYFDKIYISVSEKTQLAHIGIGGPDTFYNKYNDNNIIKKYREKIIVVEDIYVDYGPMGGLCSVLSKTDENGVCVVAVDTPFVSAETLLSFIPSDDIITEDRGRILQKPEKYYCVSHAHKRIQPLCGWYSKECLPVLQKLIDDHNLRMLTLLEMLPGKIIYIEDSNVLYGKNITEFFNMNDRQSYYEALDAVRHLESRIPMVSFAAWSGTGKTTYIEKLIPKLLKKNIKVAVIKHDGHDFEIDVEGKDTYRLKKAGAVEVVISSKTKMAKIASVENEKLLYELISEIDQVDLIIVEGYKYGKQPKIEIHRSTISDVLMENITNRIAIISDKEWDVGVPSYNIEDYDSVVDFICAKLLGFQ